MKVKQQDLMMWIFLVIWMSFTPCITGQAPATTSVNVITPAATPVSIPSSTPYSSLLFTPASIPASTSAPVILSTPGCRTHRRRYPSYPSYNICSGGVHATLAPNPTRSIASKPAPTNCQLLEFVMIVS